MSFSVKIVALLTALAALIIGVGLVSHRVLGSTSGELENRISKVEENMNANDWKSAEKNVSHLQDKWGGVKGIWAVLIDHQEIDNIDVTLARMQKFVQSKDLPSASAETSALKKFVKHIPIKEALSFENIF